MIQEMLLTHNYEMSSGSCFDCISYTCYIDIVIV